MEVQERGLEKFRVGEVPYILLRCDEWPTPHSQYRGNYRYPDDAGVVGMLHRMLKPGESGMVEKSFLGENLSSLFEVLGNARGHGDDHFGCEDGIQDAHHVYLSDLVETALL